MAKVKVETYSIQAKKRNSRKEEDYYALDDITGAHYLFEIVIEHGFYNA